MNNTEFILLKLLLYNNNYIKYQGLIDLDYIKEISPELYNIYKSLKDLYLITDIVTLEDLKVFFYTNTNCNKEKYDLIFEALETLSVSEAVVENVLEELHRKKCMLKLSETAFNYTQSRATIEDVTQAYDSLVKPQTVAVEDQFISDDLEELLNSVVITPGLKPRLNCLKKALGSLRKGDFGAIFARPETGKTTWLASEASYIVDQIPDDQSLIWLKFRPA